MNRRTFLQTAGAAPLALASLSRIGRLASHRRRLRPNILFIFSDDHAVQAIGAFRSQINKTPNIDRIAAEGGYRVPIALLLAGVVRSAVRADRELSPVPLRVVRADGERQDGPLSVGHPALGLSHDRGQGPFLRFIRTSDTTQWDTDTWLIRF